tara:strand:+ start:847 stop:999 length:153 start_codon:yes stop_codon:yes gene_type:complete
MKVHTRNIFLQPFRAFNLTYARGRQAVAHRRQIASSARVNYSIAIVRFSD